MKSIFNIKSIFTTTILSGSVLVFAAFGNPTDSGIPAITQETEVSENYLLINHVSGETYVPINPQLIAIFEMAILSTLDYLGLGDRIIGLNHNQIPAHLSHFDPTGDNNLHDFGTLHDPNIEELIVHDIDLIIISGRARPHFDELSLIAPTIDLGLEPGNQTPSFFENMRAIGAIFEIEEEIEKSLDNIESEIESLRELASEIDKNALIILHNEGQFRAHGPGGRWMLIHDDIGIPSINMDIEAVNHGSLISSEYILYENPDIIFVMDRTEVVEGLQLDRSVIENEIIQLTDAFQNNNIIYLDTWTWYISPGSLIGFEQQLAEIRTALENVN